MLEKILANVLLTFLGKLLSWASQEVSEAYKEWQQDKSDAEREEKLRKAKTKEEKVKRAKDNLDSVFRPRTK